MCSPCRRDYLADADLETFDPIADAMDTKRHARERAERAAAGIPEPTLSELAQGFAPNYTCRVKGCEDVITEGAWCVVHNLRWSA